MKKKLTPKNPSEKKALYILFNNISLSLSHIVCVCRRNTQKAKKNLREVKGLIIWKWKKDDILIQYFIFIGNF